MKVMYFFLIKKSGLKAFSYGENALINLKNLDYGIIRIGASTIVSKNILILKSKLSTF